MQQKTFCLIAGLIFSVVALCHLARLLMGWSLVVDGWEIPLWCSGVGLVIAGVLAGYGLRFGTRK